MTAIHNLPSSAWLLVCKKNSNACYILDCSSAFRPDQLTWITVWWNRGKRFFHLPEKNCPGGPLFVDIEKGRERKK
jgi:hypothetical protein